MKTVTQIAEALTPRKPTQKPQKKAEHPGVKPDRAPYSFNIGLDFGTAFSKCVLRDTRLSPSRAFVVPFQHGGESPLLVPSEVYCNGAVLSTPLTAETHTPPHTLSYLKMAYYATLRGQRTDPWLLGIAQHWPDDDETELHRKVEALVVFYLGALLRSCFDDLKKRRPDFGDHPDDSLSVNMAVPAAHAQDEAVEEAFLRCLNLAWQLANNSSDPTMSIADCIAAIREIKLVEDQHACYLYQKSAPMYNPFSNHLRASLGFSSLSTSELGPSMPAPSSTTQTRKIQNPSLTLPPR